MDKDNMELDDNIVIFPKEKYRVAQPEEQPLWRGIFDMSLRDYGSLLKAIWVWTGDKHYYISARKYLFLLICACVSLYYSIGSLYN